MNGLILRDVLAEICMKASGKNIYTKNATDKSPEWFVASYSCSQDFEFLWLSKDLWKWLDRGGVRNIILIWDGMPEPDGSSVNVLDHITPVDWAMALSHRLLQNKKNEVNKTVPELRILICDISQQNYASAFAVRMLPAICHGMPWLRVYRPIESSESSMWFGRGFETLVNDIKQIDPDKFASLLNAGPGLLEPLVHTWMGSVTESGSHHDVSNLLGPLVLSTGFKNSELSNGLLKNKPARYALLEKMKWLGLAADMKEEDEKDCWYDFSKDASKLVDENESVKIVLIDDQANQGWLDILNAALGVKRSNTDEVSKDKIVNFATSGAVEVYASTSYHAIKKILEQNEIVDADNPKIENTDRRFRFSLTGNGAEILLLDLRLFFDVKYEIEYFEWSLGVARKLKMSLPANLETWIEEAKTSEPTKWRRDKEYLELLTLLPRILATIDMSLPIVIFSSTGQRQVTEALKAYGNIITVFEKPRFFGYASGDIIKETRGKFSQALAGAVKMLRARIAIQELLKNFSPKAVSAPQKNEQQQQEKYVEIFVDESGEPEENNNFVVAGIALVHENVEQARNLHHVMENTTVSMVNEAGKELDVKLKWYGKSCMPKRLGSPDERKKIFQPVLEQLNILFSKHTDSCMAFSLSAELGGLKSSGKLKGLGKHNLDSAYFELFEWLIDAVLYEFLPEKLGYKSKLKFKIYGATRLRTKDDKTTFSQDEKTALSDNWGIDRNTFQEQTDEITLARYGLYQSLSRMSFVPLVVNVISGRPYPKAEYMSDGSSILGAVGFSLKYGDNTPPSSGDSFRHAHYIADLVANFTYISLGKSKNRERDAFKGFFKARFADRFDDGFKAAVDASKYLESGQRVEAFLRAVGAGRYHIASRQEDCPESLISTILSKICGEVGAFTRSEFYEFSAALGEWWLDYGDPVAKVMPGKAYAEDSYPGLRTTLSKGKGKGCQKKWQSIISKPSPKKVSSPPPDKPGLVITLATLNEQCTDVQIEEAVKNVLQNEFSHLPINMGKSNQRKRVCKIISISENEYEKVYNKLSAAKGSGIWRNCERTIKPAT